VKASKIEKMDELYAMGNNVTQKDKGLLTDTNQLSLFNLDF